VLGLDIIGMSCQYLAEWDPERLIHYFVSIISNAFRALSLGILHAVEFNA